VIAPPVVDPFELETTLREPRVLSFSPRTFEIPLPELLRHLAYDLIGHIPRPLGDVREEIGSRGDAFTFHCEFSHVGPSVLAVGTEVEHAEATHRVLEMLGVDGDVRIRINMTLLARSLADTDEDLARAAREAVGAGRALGQVRIWGSNGSTSEVRRTLETQMIHAGIDTRVLDRSVREPEYRPPAAGRLTLESFPADDRQVEELLLNLLTRLPAGGSQVRSPRQIACHTVRHRNKGSIVNFHYETHRNATGVLHMRRREVEAGLERPGLVRTFNVAGLRGAGRLRIRDVGARVSAEFAGTNATVNAIAETLQRTMGGRP